MRVWNMDGGECDVFVSIRLGAPGGSVGYESLFDILAEAARTSRAHGGLRMELCSSTSAAQPRRPQPKQAGNFFTTKENEDAESSSPVVGTKKERQT